MKRSEYMAIRPSFLSKYARKYDSAIEAGIVERIMKDAQDDIDDQYPKVYQKKNGVGIINLYGPMSEDGPDWIDIYLGYYGTAYKNLIRAAEEAEKDDEVQRIIININTPGGNIDGLEAAYQSLANLAKKKQCIAYNHGMIASAGVWYASACDKIIAANPAALIGSIGVVIDTFDFTGFYTEMGIQEITITNTDSPNKRPNLTTEAGQDIMRKELDALFGVFVNRVVSGRSIDEPTVKSLKGEMIIAADAVRIGLMDEIEGETVAADSAGSSTAPEAEKSDKEILSMEADVKQAFDGISQTLSAINGRLEKVEGKGTETPAAVQGTGLSAEEKKFAANIAKSADYPERVKAEAIAVLSGESTMATLKAVVSAVDAVTEKNAGEEAAATTAETGETIPNGEVVPPAPEADNGILEGPKSIAAERKRLKGEA